MTHVERLPTPSPELGAPPPAQPGRPIEAAICARLLRRLGRPVTYLLASALVLGCFGCGKSSSLPEPSSREYNEVVRAFYTGLAALQVGDDDRAATKYAAVTRLASAEPAGWVNWGVLALRQRNFDLAAQRLERART